MPRVLGLTGNIACGKTVVGQMLLALGAERYIDADAVVHRLYEPGQPVAVRVAELFGADFLTADGSVDRKALGALVFNDINALYRLEGLVHPAVGTAIHAELEQVSPEGIAVIDAVKLLEGRSVAFCQSKWLVICDAQQELERLMARSHLTQAEALARLAAQPDTASRIPLVDEVIDNSGTLAETRQQVEAAFERFCRAFPLAASIDL